MKHLGRLLALIGLALGIWLFLKDDPKAILVLLEDAGLGLVLASIVHVLPMMLNAQAWKALLPGAHNPALISMLRVVWIRESINGLLPVARIGGEIASYRLLRHLHIHKEFAIASLTVDVTLSIFTQLIFALAGIAFLYQEKASGFAARIALGMVLLALVGCLLVFVSQAGLFERLMRLLNRVALGRFEEAIDHSVRIDRTIQALYRRRYAILSCAMWQLAGWIAGAIEVWTALWFLGEPHGMIDALIIESIIQAVASAAFLIPGALGIQEAAFLLVGTAVGLDPAGALALAAFRRLRDCIIFMPGLISWQIAEVQIARDAG